MPHAESGVPSVFLSYSWTSPEYADQVDQFARDLANAKVHVVLDQWDLKEGHDKYAFMERCVSDPSIDKVLILIDPRYVERADNRDGGVGSETVIISPEVYERTAQDRFIPVIMARDDDGKVRLPTYLKSRIYIDLSDPERYEDQFERLIRNVHGRPQRQRPSLGEMPLYLADDAVELSTGRSLAAFRNALLQEKRTQSGYLADYLERVVAAFSSEKGERPPTIDELELQVSASIERWTPYRDEFIEMLKLLARYGERADLYEHLHGFFEQLLNIRDGHRQVRWGEEVEVENLAFIGWELFMCSVAVLLRAHRYDGVESILAPYHVTDWAGRGSIQEFSHIGGPFRLLQVERQRRLGSRWLTAAAQLLKERRADSVTWESLAEADTLLWSRSWLAVPRQANWHPLTAAYMEYEGPGSLPLWRRVRSDEKFFSRLAPLLTVSNRQEAEARLANLPNTRLVSIGHTSLSRATLAFMLGVVLPETER